jgi:hypothetical protein
MRRTTFEITVTRSETPLDTRRLARLVAASAYRQHLAALASASAPSEEHQGASGRGRPETGRGPSRPPR